MTDRFDPPLPEEDDTTGGRVSVESDEVIAVQAALIDDPLPESEASGDDAAGNTEPEPDSGDAASAPDVADMQPFDAEEVVATAAPLRPPPGPGDSEDEFKRWQRATGAFVLGALEPDEATLAAGTYAGSEEIQAELITMLPVADILTSLYSSQPTPGTTATATSPVPEGPTQAPAVPRPAGRPQRPTQPVVISTPQWRSASPILLGVLGVLAALGFLWALAQRDQITTKDTEIDALRTQVAELSVAGNASVFVLNPASDAGARAKATVFYSPGDGTVLLDARGLPELEEDHVYQVWFAAAGTDAWRAGPIFTVNDSGDAVRRLPGDAPDFGRMAISDEPAPGTTDAPDEFLLLGELVVAAE